MLLLRCTQRAIHLANSSPCPTTLRPLAIAPRQVLIVDWLKTDDWVRTQHARLLSIWEEADRPYTHEHGISPSLSIAKGKITPSEAEKEHQRQKDLGWDVHGNLDKDKE